MTSSIDELTSLATDMTDGRFWSAVLADSEYRQAQIAMAVDTGIKIVSAVMYQSTDELNRPAGELVDIINDHVSGLALHPAMLEQLHWCGEHAIKEAVSASLISCMAVPDTDWNYTLDEIGRLLKEHCSFDQSLWESWSDDQRALHVSAFEMTRVSITDVDDEE